MANATLPTDQDPLDFLAAVEPERRRLEGETLLGLMEKATGQPAVMWGPSIVGFGSYTYKYASGRQGDWLRVGFSPRKAALSLYGLKDHADAAELLAELGPHTGGVGCIYVKRLDTLDLDVLSELVRRSYSLPKETEA
ncbi:MAG: DUF1801 domain-containing protein [Demequinaceae bacterium]|nr:DUF1801 domain-containing protein [Demequinaceae bacterium]